MKFFHGLVIALLAGLPAFATAHADDASANRRFPDPKNAWESKSVFISPANIRLVRIGMHKSQVYPLLGVPHFYEGIGAHRWTYMLDFYTGKGSEYTTCELMLHYTNGLISDIAWRDGQCAGMVAAAEGAD